MLTELRTELAWQRGDRREIRWLAPGLALVLGMESSMPVANVGEGLSFVLVVYSRENAKWKSSLRYQDAPIFAGNYIMGNYSAPSPPGPGNPSHRDIIHRLSERPKPVALSTETR